MTGFGADEPPQAEDPERAVVAAEESAGRRPGTRPILPGVAQTHLAVLIAQKLWGDWPSDSNLQKLKFKRVLLPGDAVVLKLKRDAAIGRLSFVYHFRDIDASQGEIGGFTPPA